MRCLLASMVGLACLLMLGQTGCTNKGVELKMDQTAPWTEKDGKGNPAGGKNGPMPKWTGPATEPGKPAPPK